VSGRVLDPKGQPASDVAVAVQPCGDHVYTNAQGRFTAVCSEKHGANGGLVTARDVKRGLAAAVLFGDPSQPIELKLGPAWTLTGRVTDPNGAGIPAVRVSLHVDVLNCLCDPGVEVLTDPAGRFEMKAIPPVRTGFGPYRISANAAGYGPADCRKIFPRGPAGTSVNLGTIRLPKADASVSGTVVDAKGMPAAGIWVGVGQQAGMTQPKRGTVTNERGEFTLTCLCPGPIFLQAGSRNSPGGAGFLKTCLPARDVKIVLGKGLSKSPESSIPDLALAGTKEEYALLRAHCPAFPWRPAWEGFAARQAVWSVKSLPWLILTDRRHAVVAAGFKLNELDKRMAEALVQWNVLPGCLSFEQIRKSQ
jgi:protocatechuate 3,4-dioxygenase beta subunit